MHNEIENARESEQRVRMLEHEKNGRCHFCPEGFRSHKSPVLYDNQYWFVTKNDFPYTGSINHYLIVCKRHVRTFESLTPNEVSGMFMALHWLVYLVKTEGYTIFLRSGNMRYTGATLDHLHVHFISGVEKSGPDHKMIYGPLGYQK